MSRISQRFVPGLTGVLLAAAMAHVPTLALADEVVFFEDFESGVVGNTVTADRVVESSSLIPGDPGAVAQYTDQFAASGSQSLVLQDSILASDGNAPEVFWDLDNGNPLDITRTVKISYWQRVSSQTILGTQGFSEPATQESNPHFILTASNSQGVRPEGNGLYLAQAWNWTEGPGAIDQPSGVYNNFSATASGSSRGSFGDGLPTDTWHLVENYIPLVDQGSGNATVGTEGVGSPAFFGDIDPVTGEFSGYQNPTLEAARGSNVFYSRTLNEDLTSVLGQTPYGSRRPSGAGAAGGSNGEFLVRTLQLFGGGFDNSTVLYDDITVEYINTGDITAANEGITAGVSNIFDYNADDVVDEADRDYYVRNVLQTAFGDTNYDYVVDSTDLSNIAANFGTETSGWENGDVNGDGRVDEVDIDRIAPFWLNTLGPLTANGVEDFAEALEIAGIVIGGDPSIVGDYDDSGQVEQGDLNLVLNNWGQPAPFDPNGDPFETVNVDQEELNRVLNNWGATAAPSFSGAAVPEPATLGVAALSLMLLQRRRHA